MKRIRPNLDRCAARAVVRARGFRSTMRVVRKRPMRRAHRVRAAARKSVGANGKPKGSHAGGGSRKAGGAQGKRGGQQGGARTKGAAKKGNSKKGNGRG